MTPYEREFSVTTTVPNQVVALDYPGRCTLDRITVVRSGGGALAVDMYSRAFVGSLINVFLITNDGSGKCYLQLKTAFACKVGDQVVVAGNFATAYNTTHRITEIVDDFNVVTDQTYTVDATGGTAQVSIPTDERELYRVAEQVTGTSPVFLDLLVVYKNQDALANRNIGVNRKIYLSFAAAASYRVAIRSHEGIAAGIA